MPLFALTLQGATLAAAVIAAAAALVTLAVGTLSSRGQANRAAHRSIVAPRLSTLGKAIHEVTAGGVLVHRRAQQGQAPGNALTNAERASNTLKDERLEIKYSLTGLDEAIRVLTRIPNWVPTYRGDATGDPLVEQMQQLSKRLDQVIARSYRKGRPPVWWERKALDKAAKETREIWERRFGRDPDADPV